MYLYASEHALMDYHLNENKKGGKAPLETPPSHGVSADKNE